MIKTQQTIRELISQHQENAARIEEIALDCERENRERTESEGAEYAKLKRANEIIAMKLSALQSPALPSLSVNPDKKLRDALNAKQEAHVVLYRDTEFMKTTDLEGTGIIPIQEEEMLKPLRAGLIWNLVGLNVRSGLKGTLRWPKHGKATASFADEGARLTDSKIDFSKLEMTGERMGVAIPVTREELNDSEGIVEGVVREEMPAAIIDLINDALFTTEKGSKKVYGPFVEGVQTVDFAGEVPTRKELLKMKATVTKSGIKLTNPCWVMTEEMKAELEDQKVDAGSGRFVCENDKIFGIPVYTTPTIGEGAVGFGDWSYQAAGFFGPWDMIVDPYTLARNHATDFVLNARFGTVTLYKEAFVLGKKKA